jgi:hypothetical protein
VDPAPEAATGKHAGKIRFKTGSARLIVLDPRASFAKSLGGMKPFPPNPPAMMVTSPH